VDTLYTILKNDEVVWSGELNRPVSGGSEEIIIEGMGAMRFYFGTDDQPANADVAEIIGDATLNSPLRGLCWAFFGACAIGAYNRIPTMRFIVRKTPGLSFSTKHLIQTVDYNPAHAIWHILIKMAGLPETWLHTADFAFLASKLSLEGRGISILFSQPQSPETLLQTINSHIDAIIRYGSDGKFHPKLIRNDYDVDTLPVIDESVMLDTPAFNRGSWIETMNEIKVQYPEITERPAPWTPRGCIGWYKVDEESGLILYNSAPAGANKLPDLDIVVPNANFWSQVPGFGYWDISPIVTQAYKTWAAMTPFPTAEGTIIYFAKEARGVPTATTNDLVGLKGSIAFFWSYLKNHDTYNQTIHKAGCHGDDAYMANVNFSPRRYNKAFIAAFTLNASLVSTLKVKYDGDGAWTTDAGKEPSGFNSGNVTGLYLGCSSSFLGVAGYTWKGLLGDVIICNVLLTTDEIDEIIIKLGERWEIP
jgi:hypothetical protein